MSSNPAECAIKNPSLAEGFFMACIRRLRRKPKSAAGKIKHSFIFFSAGKGGRNRESASEPVPVKPVSPQGRSVCGAWEETAGEGASSCIPVLTKHRNFLKMSTFDILLVPFFSKRPEGRNVLRRSAAYCGRVPGMFRRLEFSSCRPEEGDV